MSARLRPIASIGHNRRKLELVDMRQGGEISWESIESISLWANQPSET